MSRQECEEFNVVGLARSPVKRTPRSYGPGAAGDSSLSGATTARMSVGSVLSTGGGVCSVGSSSAAASEARRRHKVLQPLVGNNMLDNSVYSTAYTPCSASTLDMMSSTISSKKKALAARRSSLPVSRMLKLSPAMDTTRQHEQESVIAEARTGAEGSSTPYSQGGDHTQCSMTQSALFSTLDRLPRTPHGVVSPPNQHSKPTSHSGPLNNRYQDLPSTPLADSRFLGSGDISNIDQGDVWSDCSFNNAVFSPDPATPEVAHGGIGDGDRGANARSEQAQATEVSQILQGEGHSSPPAAKTAMRASSSMDITHRYPSSAASSACTPAAVTALLRMGEHPDRTVLTPNSVTDDTSRSRGYADRSPIATSGATSKEGDESGRVEVPNTPAAAAALAAMMMGTGGSVHGSEAVTIKEEGDEVRGFAEGEATKDEDEQSASTGVQVCAQGITFVVIRWSSCQGCLFRPQPLLLVDFEWNGASDWTSALNIMPPQLYHDSSSGVWPTTSAFMGRWSLFHPRPAVFGLEPALHQVQQPKQPTPETPSRRVNMSARLPMITPRRRKAASQLLDLSKATPRGMIR